jgi:hypothetical protein
VAMSGRWPSKKSRENFALESSATQLYEFLLPLQFVKYVVPKRGIVFPNLKTASPSDKGETQGVAETRTNKLNKLFHSLES